LHFSLTSTNIMNLKWKAWDSDDTKKPKHSLTTFFSNKTSTLITPVIDLAHFFVFDSV